MIAIVIYIETNEGQKYQLPIFQTESNLSVKKSFTC